MMAGMAGDKKSSPIVDASDTQRLALTLPYLLEGLFRNEVATFNAKRKKGRKKVIDKTEGFIDVVENFLEMYANYRCVLLTPGPQLNTDSELGIPRSPPPPLSGVKDTAQWM